MSIVDTPLDLYLHKRIEKHKNEKNNSENEEIQ